MREKIEPGLYRIPEEKYHATEAFSKSGASKLLRSPAHFRIKTIETPAMVIGTAFHRAVLERDRFKALYACKPEGMSFATKDGKAWKADNEDKIILSYADYTNVLAMSDAVWNNPDAAFLLGKGEAEVSGFFHDPLFPDVPCKMRIDFLNTETGFVIDLKKCTDAREHAFKRDAYKFGYHIQAFLYSLGMSLITGADRFSFYFIAVESDPPHGVMVYRASPAMINEGMADAYLAMEMYRDCMAANSWPGYPEGIVDLDVPEWVKNKRITGGIYDY
jgi:hypothetical protein